MPSPPYKTESVKAKDLETNDLIIAFMGPAGSGKSQIIDTLTGQPGRRATSSLEPNKDITAFRVLNHEKFGRRLVLIETPGVDSADAKRSTDGKILEMIGKWLSNKNVSLSGIVYTHQISENRMTGQADRNMAKFVEPCGDKWAQSIALVTTMWDKAKNFRDTEAQWQAREEKLGNYWKVMIDNGASLDRFDNTPESAWPIIRRMVEARAKVAPQGDEGKWRSSGIWGRLFGRAK